MTYTDAQLRLSNAQSLAGAAATTVSTNVEDLLSPYRNEGRGQRVRLLVTCDASFTGGTSVQIQYIQSASSNMSSPTVLASSAVIADAAALAGRTLWDIQLPDNTQRYVAVQYVTLGTHTTGTVSANLVSDSDFNNYPPMNTGY